MNKQSKRTVIVFTNNQFVFYAIRQILSTVQNINLSEPLLKKSEYIIKICPDIIIYDIDFVEDLLQCNSLKKKFPHSKIITLANYDNFKIINSLICFGVSSILLKDNDTSNLCYAIEELKKGNNYFCNKIKNDFIESFMVSKKKPLSLNHLKLSSRESEIVKLIIDENTTTEIALKLCLSKNTIESHRKNILQKFNCKNVAGLVKNAIIKGYYEYI